jgi:hypothetical protein
MALGDRIIGKGSETIAGDLMTGMKSGWCRAIASGS